MCFAGTPAAILGHSSRPPADQRKGCQKPGSPVVMLSSVIALTRGGESETPGRLAVYRIFLLCTGCLRWMSGLQSAASVSQPGGWVIEA